MVATKTLIDIARLRELNKEEEESRYEQRRLEFLAKYDGEEADLEGDEEKSATNHETIRL